ncbi:MAG: hypothetical protein DMG13_21630 [Acidobacteria bacterium]|nr:MAG: hypothetical protein DMG13_21630 [Acidobacteriota bacterium]
MFASVRPLIHAAQAMLSAKLRQYSTGCDRVEANDSVAIGILWLSFGSSAISLWAWLWLVALCKRLGHFRPRSSFAMLR